MMAVLTGQKPDRIPVFYRATQETSQKLKKYLRCSSEDDILDRLHIDKEISVQPEYAGPALDSNMDIFGCQYRSIDYGCGFYQECVGHPLMKYETVEEIDANYIWPSADWFDYTVIPDQISGREESILAGGGWEPFLIYKYLRGEEQAFVVLILNPDIVCYCMEKLFTYHYEKSKRTFEMADGKILISSSSEDLGAQSGLLYSPEHIRNYFLPLHKRMIDLIHQAGAYVMWHSDGAIRGILPDLIDLGIDILDPIQWRCAGMNREELKKDFGSRLVFRGGMDNQYTLPFGTAEEVMQEVMDNIRILGKNGGYIFGPCHNIQAVGPAENIIAMYDTAYEYGKVL
jgi:uroporphyrinogen decarboxylase